MKGKDVSEWQTVSKRKKSRQRSPSRGIYNNSKETAHQLSRRDLLAKNKGKEKEEEEKKVAEENRQSTAPYNIEAPLRDDLTSSIEAPYRRLDAIAKLIHGGGACTAVALRSSKIYIAHNGESDAINRLQKGYSSFFQRVCNAIVEANNAGKTLVPTLYKLPYTFYQEALKLAISSCSTSLGIEDTDLSSGQLDIAILEYQKVISLETLTNSPNLVGNIVEAVNSALINTPNKDNNAASNAWEKVDIQKAEQKKLISSNVQSSLLEKGAKAINGGPYNCILSEITACLYEALRKNTGLTSINVNAINRTSPDVIRKSVVGELKSKIKSLKAAILQREAALKRLPKNMKASKENHLWYYFRLIRKVINSLEPNFQRDKYKSFTAEFQNALSQQSNWITVPQGQSGKHWTIYYNSEANKWECANQNSNMHAEMKVINYLYGKKLLEAGNPLYIGLSKLCCFMCSRAIVELNKHPLINYGRKIEPIRTRGRHDKAYAGWQCPELFSKNFVNSLVKALNEHEITVGDPAQGADNYDISDSEVE